MAQISIHWSGNGLARLKAAVDKLGNEGQSRTVLRRALNHTGNKAFTIVKRTLAQQIGASQAAILKYGKVRKVPATSAALEFLIISKGGPIPLKHFKARQVASGVSAAPWRNRKIYDHAFIVPSLGGHAFWRMGSGRLPIKRIAGPNVPKEMVKDQVAVAFNALVSTNLPARVEHEIRVLTDGVVS